LEPAKINEEVLESLLRDAHPCIDDADLQRYILLYHILLGPIKVDLNDLFANITGFGQMFDIVVLVEELELRKGPHHVFLLFRGDDGLNILDAHKHSDLPVGIRKLHGV
jgi:hypothetical protein